MRNLPDIIIVTQVITLILAYNVRLGYQNVRYVEFGNIKGGNTC